MDESTSHNWVERLSDRLPNRHDLPDWFWKVASSLFFLGGFCFDALTLGRNVNLWTLGYVGVYAAGVALCMVALVHGWFDRRRDWIRYGMHFCLGATFSALVVLYFRSASHVWGLLTVLFLAALMVWNEFASRGEPQKWLIWGIYACSLVMFFNFLLPYAIGSLSSWWFYASIAGVMSLLFALKPIARIPGRALGSSGAFSVVLVGLFWLGAIPPVPLVMKQNFPCVDARKAPGEYVCDSESPGVWTRLGLQHRTVRYKPGERVSLMSAVAAPGGVDARLEHRWYHWSDQKGWTLYDTIGVDLHGGRERGWRFYSHKRNMLPGLWRVDTAVPGGSVLSYRRFHAEPVDAETELRRHERKLR